MGSRNNTHLNLKCLRLHWAYISKARILSVFATKKNVISYSYTAARRLQFS